MAGTEALKNVNKMIGILEANEDIQKEQYSQNENTVNLSLLKGDDELMKNVTLRKDGRYVARIQYKKTRYVLYARNIRDIKAKLSKLKSDLKNINKLQTRTKYTLHSWLDFWWENYKKPFVNATSNIPIYIKKIKEDFPNNKLENYTTSMIQQLLNEYAPSRTKELIVLYLNACFQKAIDTGIIQLNPVKAVVKDRKINNVRKAFTFDEQQKIWQKIKGSKIERDIIIYLFTGIRKNEYEPNTIRQNVDTEHNTLKVRSEKKRTTNPVYRFVDLSPKMVEYILSENKEPQLSIQRIYKNFKLILDELGIKGGLHNLRHTFGTNYYYLGVPDKLRSEWLGHEKVDLTQDVYTNIDRTISKDKLISLYGDFLYKF